MDSRMRPEIISDQDRYPTLTAEGQQMLRFLREHPHAPIFRNESGNRLTTDDLEEVRKFEKELELSESGWLENEVPSWIEEFVEQCLTAVPFYRRYGYPPNALQELPSSSRGDFSPDCSKGRPE